MLRKIFLADSLVEGPFSGWPVFVVFLEKPLDKFKMVSLASELGSRQTVFVLIHGKSVLLRFFSNTQEIGLGVHACHAVTHLIYELGLLPPSEDCRLLTQEGEILAKSLAPNFTVLTLKALPLSMVAQDSLEIYERVLNLNPSSVGWAAMTQDRTAVLAVDETVNIRKLTAQPNLLAQCGAAALAVTAQDQAKSGYSLRCFSPDAAIEQVLCGNLHRSLAPQWSRLLKKREFQARQLSSRGSLIKLEIPQNDLVITTGQSKTILRCDLAMDLMANEIPVTVMGR
ncbi:MAG: PhzF family phenazine biosynthesis protein [Deltaproteobacteria bacterium]|jgi:predicted PhzF superfamily epimerase YddE/YHI9|nr:PhzF family phenazine biosynthesis protein [Deltaproteobacteria bacterium]